MVLTYSFTKHPSGPLGSSSAACKAKEPPARRRKMTRWLARFCLGAGPGRRSGRPDAAAAEAKQRGRRGVCGGRRRPRPSSSASACRTRWRPRRARSRSNAIAERPRTRRTPTLSASRRARRASGTPRRRRPPTLRSGPSVTEVCRRRRRSAWAGRPASRRQGRGDRPEEEPVSVRDISEPRSAATRGSFAPG